MESVQDGAGNQRGIQVAFEKKKLMKPLKVGLY
jgi:hypothetical protein